MLVRLRRIRRVCQRANLTYPTTANSGPTHQNSGGKLSLGLGPLPVLKTFGQRAVLPVWRNSERTGDCPWAGRRDQVVFPVPTLRFSHHGIHTEDHIQDFCSVWFIVPERSWVEFSLVSSASLKISSSVSTLAT